jgi:hypothetical protein
MGSMTGVSVVGSSRMDGRYGGLGRSATISMTNFMDVQLQSLVAVCCLIVIRAV